MQSSKPRDGSSETPNAFSPSSLGSIRGPPVSPDTANSKSARPLERRSSSKAAPSPEKGVVRASEVRQQLGRFQEHLRRGREEKAQALEEMNELKQALARRMGEGQDLGRIKMLEGEVEKAKESEMKMLESLVSQTKQLEGAKIELEEAKLEIRNLQVSIRDRESSASSRSEGILGRFREKPKPPLDSSQTHEDVVRLRTELRLAIEAEEKNKKAMDDLAFTLKDVTTEMNQLKGKLLAKQAELDKVRAEANDSALMLRTTEEKLGVISEEAERLRLEADESAAVWNAKENGFIDCMKVSEEEIARLKQENFKWAESHRITREESSKLRDIMKQALNEATVVKEALEIARSENSQLKDLLSEKEDLLQAIKQEYETLKISEAAALDSVKELKNLLAAPSPTERRTSGPNDAGSFTKPNAVTAKEDTEMRGTSKFPSEQWTSDVPRFENGLKDASSRSGPFLGSESERMTLPGRKDRRSYASLSCVSDLTGPSLHELDGGDLNFVDDFDQMDRINLEGMSNGRALASKHKKKRQLLRRFGELLRRGSTQK